MDDLEFRRTIYADPKCNDKDVIEAAKQDAAKQDFWDELKQLDGRIESACKVKVPEDLAHKLILRQTIQSHQQSSRRRMYLAVAASVVVTMGLTFSILPSSNAVDLSEHAIAHVYHEGEYALGADENVNLQQVNAKLASMGASLDQNVGRIYYANFCDFKNVRSLHMVMQGENGKVSVFVIPHKGDYKLEEHFSDERLQGEGMDFQKASVIMVSDKDKPFSELKESFAKSLVFSA